MQSLTDGSNDSTEWDQLLQQLSVTVQEMNELETVLDILNGGHSTALRQLNVARVLMMNGSTVASQCPNGATTSNGARMDANTVIANSGMPHTVPGDRVTSLNPNFNPSALALHSAHMRECGDGA